MKKSLTLRGKTTKKFQKKSLDPEKKKKSWKKYHHHKNFRTCLLLDNDSLASFAIGLLFYFLCLCSRCYVLVVFRKVWETFCKSPVTWCIATSEKVCDAIGSCIGVLLNVCLFITFLNIQEFIYLNHVENLLPNLTCWTGGGVPP